jgi:hypothetical protein
MRHAPGTRHFEIDSRILASLEARKGRFERNARIIDSGDINEGLKKGVGVVRLMPRKLTVICVETLRAATLYEDLLVLSEVEDSSALQPTDFSCGAGLKGSTELRGVAACLSELFVIFLPNRIHP